jgi:hypothetical protein
LGKGLLFPKNFVDKHMELVEVDKMKIQEFLELNNQISFQHLKKMLITYPDGVPKFKIEGYHIHKVKPTGKVYLKNENSLFFQPLLPVNHKKLTYHCPKCAFSPLSFFEQQQKSYNLIESLLSSSMPIACSLEHSGTTRILMKMLPSEDENKHMVFIDKDGSTPRVLELTFEVDVEWRLTG